LKPRDDALPADGARVAAVALAVTLALQVYTAFAGSATSVLAPEIARDLGLAPRLVGVYTGLMYIGSMLGALACSGFIERYGSIRVSQACVLLCVLGIALTAVAGAVPGIALLVLIVAPIIVGLGYGPITPASSHVLARTAPPSRMALTFSIKQTGVPAGGALAGALLPVIALVSDWTTTFALIIVLGVAIALIAQPTRGQLDADRTEGAPLLSVTNLMGPLALLVRTPVLLELAIVSAIYAAVQVCLWSFLVLYLTESLGFSLVAAGLALTVANTGGIVGRILWGAVADLIGAPRALLGMLGACAAICAWTTVMFDPAWPRAVMLVVCAIFGSTAIGWNGVQLAELARHAPAGQAGAVTGAAQFIGFGGVVVGPPIFALISTISGGYRAGFVVFGVLSMACGLRLLWRKAAV
jgi:MFS family permease